jgi:hypothetical protein
MNVIASNVSKDAVGNYKVWDKINKQLNKLNIARSSYVGNLAT